MGEVRREVKTYEVQYQCDACGQGLMKPTGLTSGTISPQYRHQCDRCPRRAFLGDSYPIKVRELASEPQGGRPVSEADAVSLHVRCFDTVWRLRKIAEGDTPLTPDEKRELVDAARLVADLARDNFVGSLKGAAR